MSGSVPFLFDWVPGREYVGAFGRVVLAQTPAGLGRQIAEVVWLLAAYLLWKLVELSVWCLVKVAEGVPTGVRGAERLLMWIDYRAVAAAPPAFGASGAAIWVSSFSGWRYSGS